jgi:hypothetical protein
MQMAPASEISSTRSPSSTALEAVSGRRLHERCDLVRRQFGDVLQETGDPKINPYAEITNTAASPSRPQVAEASETRSMPKAQRRRRSADGSTRGLSTPLALVRAPAAHG